MRPSYLCFWLTFVLSLACAKDPTHPLVGQWEGSCSFPGGTATYDLRVVDNGGYCEVCEGDYRGLDGYADYSGPDGTLWSLEGVLNHCADESGCVDVESTALDLNYLQYIGRPVGNPGLLTTWFVGAYDPDDPDQFDADGAHAPAQQIGQEGPCTFVRTQETP